MRIPRGLHMHAGAYAPDMFAWGPGWRRTGAQPIRRIAIGRYTVPVQNVPLTGGQGQATVGGGVASVTVGPQGAGNIWYPAQATISTTSGVNDGSTCSIYLGPNAQTAVILVATLFPGGYGTAALAIPSMAPGQYLTAIWTGAHNGDIVAMNVIGIMSALASV